MSDESKPGVPDFTQVTKGTRHGRQKVSYADFLKLAERVAALEDALYGKKAQMRTASKPAAKPRPKKAKE